MDYLVVGGAGGDAGVSEHRHCWHAYGGPIYMVLEDGQVVQVCCECRAKRVVHGDHATRP